MDWLAHFYGLITNFTVSHPTIWQTGNIVSLNSCQMGF